MSKRARVSRDYCEFVRAERESGRKRNEQRSARHGSAMHDYCEFDRAERESWQHLQVLTEGVEWQDTWQTPTALRAPPSEREADSYRPSGTSLREGGRKGSLLRELAAPIGAD